MRHVRSCSLRRRPQNPQRAGASWLDVLVFGGLITVLVLGLGVWAYQSTISSYHGARAGQCKNNLKQWGLALYNYQDTFSCFPPYCGGSSGNGERLSGRAMLLPFLECAPLWDAIATAPNQGGDPMKLTIPASMSGEMEVFICPSSSPPPMVDGQAHSSYVFNVGDQIDFGTGVDDFPMQEKTRGPFGWRHCTRMKDITDGLNSTIFMAERDLGNPANSRDILGRVAKLAATSPANCAATASGEFFNTTTLVLSELPGERWSSGHPFYSVFTAALPPNRPSCAASVPPSGKSVGGWFTASSRHTGGCYVLFGDGTVRFINNNIHAGDQSATKQRTEGRSSYGIWGSIGANDGQGCGED